MPEAKPLAKLTGLVALLFAMALALAAAIVPEKALSNIDTGAVWTTDEQQPPQDKNIYLCGETIFLTGDFFTALARHSTGQIYYEILKLPHQIVKRGAIPVTPKPSRDFEGVPILTPAEYASFLEGVPNEYQVSAYYGADFAGHKIASDNFKIRCGGQAAPVLSVHVTPHLATNEVNRPHTFTVTVLRDGNPAPAGTIVNVSVTLPGYFTRIGSQTITGVDTRSGQGAVDAQGRLTVEVNSSFVGMSTLRAWVDMDSDATFDLGEPTDTGQKEWVMPPAPTWLLEVTPHAAMNMVGEEHVFTVRVLMNGQPAPLGTRVRISITPPGYFTQISGQPVTSPGVRLAPATVGWQGLFTVRARADSAGTSTFRAWIDGDGDAVWTRTEPNATACKVWTGPGVLTKTFRLIAVGPVPEGATLWAAWGDSADNLVNRLRLDDPDRDGVYTGAVTLPQGSVIWWNLLKVQGTEETPLLPSPRRELLPLGPSFVNQETVEFPAPPPAVPLSITKVADPSELERDRSVTLAYTIVVSNLSTSAAAEEVRVKDNDLPAFFSLGQVLVESQAADASALPTGILVGDMGPSESRTLHLAGTASPTLSGDFPNTAWTWAKNASPMSANALVRVVPPRGGLGEPGTTTTTSSSTTTSTSTTSTTLAAASATTTSTTTTTTTTTTTLVAPVRALAIPADVEIAKRVSASQAVPGGTLRYTILVRNAGGAPLTQVEVGDPIPAGSNYQWGSASGARFLSAERGLLWRLGTLRPGESRTLTFQVKVAANAPSLLENVATVDTRETRPKEASAETVILRKPRVITFAQPKMPITK